MHKRLLFALLCLVLLPGCWNRVEIDELAIVRAVAVDYLPGRKAPYFVTLSVIKPGQFASGDGGGGANPTVLFSGVGATIELAIQQASFTISRRIYLSHNEVLLLGEEAARHGLHDILDFILRSSQMRLTNFLLVVPGMAHEALHVKERLEGGITDEILGLVRQAQVSSEANPQELFKILRQLSTPGQEACVAVLRVGIVPEKVLPQVEEADKQMENQKNGSNKQEGGGETETEPKQQLVLAGTAVFRGGRLAGFLNEIETRGFLWLTNGVKRGIIEVHDPQDPEETVGLGIIRAEAKITPSMEKGKISFLVEVEEEGDIFSQTGPSDTSSPEVIKLLNSAKAGAIKEEIEKALYKLQDLGTDIVGFGAALNRRYPREFAKLGGQWPEIFRGVEIEVRVTANVRRSGLLSRPARISR